MPLHLTEVFQSNHRQLKLTAESFNGDLKEICCRTKIEVNLVIAAKEEEPAVRGFKKLSPLGAIPFAGLKAQGLLPCFCGVINLHPLGWQGFERERETT